ncbi:hypothetical protein B7C42_01197 [Nocardia cerradoensis]|uniref:Uncharacterized protein n=1 Tax=Nocardia cerradoensis TaxID=85688 RepID=A0A231HBI8_9NOCA|nr:DUF3824 domain-containing protein [Nocardia cerradoensis]OXR46231.1 hypothetical protein B7C42_01197 [Nocardia cerradoensis]
MAGLPMRPGFYGAELFGLLTPCAHSAAKYGLDAADWRTHMCGLCLGLRDGHGQLARTATNTDAIVLNVLTEAQAGAAARTAAGPCALRGMQRASVAAAGSPGVRLATTASLLLGAAKIRDHADDGDTGPLARRPMRKVADRWFASARANAADIDLDIEPLIAAIGRQTELEQSVRTRSRTADFTPLELLATLTEPAQTCAAELFAHSAVLAGRPENVTALREVGWHFGRIAHVADAIEDLDDDRRRNRFNPLLATGASAEQAHGLLRESDAEIRRALHQAKLAHVPAVRWLLLDPLRGVVRKLGRTAAAACGGVTSACGCGKGGGAALSHDTDTSATARLLGYPVAAVHIRPRAVAPATAGPSTEARIGKAITAQHPFQPGPYPSAPGPYQPNPAGPQVNPAAYPDQGPYPASPVQPYDIPPPFGDRPPSDPYPPADEPPHEPPRRPTFWQGVGIICGVYCTGYACCAGHRRPCSGEHRDAWLQRCDCDCDCCDCGDCEGCGDCCSCCNGCGDCDCDCCGCDCSC